MPAITEIARAKINLTLKVRGRRPDGYLQLSLGHSQFSRTSA